MTLGSRESLPQTVMKSIGIGKILRAAERFRGLLGPRATILLHHRVTDSASDPSMLRVTPQRFAEHLQVIREFGHPMRLQELARSLSDGALAEGAICMTFDDGYHDTLYTAKLEQYDMPGTVFMTTGAIGRSREF